MLYSHSLNLEGGETHPFLLAKSIARQSAWKWCSFHHNIFVKSQLDGWMSALPEFMASLINVPDAPYPSDLNKRISGNMDFFFKHEYKTFVEYLPNGERIRSNNVHMAAAISRESSDAYYVQATRARR